MNAKQRDILCYVIFLIFGSAMLYFSLGIKKMIDTDVGSGYVPAFVAICILIASGLKLIITLLGHGASSIKKKKKKNDLMGGLVTIGLMAIYVAVFESVGFLLSSMVYLFAQIMLMSNSENRKPLLFAGISVVLPIGVYLLFEYVIQMPLPSGILGL